MNINEIKELVALLKENDLKLIKVKDNQVSVHIEAKDEGGIVSPPQAASVNAPVESSVVQEAGEGIYEIRSPQIGTFYTQPSADSPETFVSVGDVVEASDQIGLVEVMKIFTDVHAGVSGQIEEVLVSNGQHVEYDQVLMRVKVTGG